MKRLIYLLFLIQSVSVATAQIDQQPVKLVGLVDALGMKLAVVHEQIHGNRSGWDLLLKEGQRMGDVEVSKIDSANGTINAGVSGKPCLLALDAPGGSNSTNKIEHPAPPVIDLVSVSLDTAISLYADFKSRTVLQHPLLDGLRISLQCNPRTRDEAVAAFEKMFNTQKIATIPDGNKFVMVVPFAFTNAVVPRSASLPQTNNVLPQLSVNFRGAPFQLMMRTYSDFVGKKMLNIESVPGMPFLTFCQTTPLSRAEIIYAMETQMAWRNIQLVTDANDDLKWEPIHPPH